MEKHKWLLSAAIFNVFRKEEKLWLSTLFYGN